LNKEVLRNQDIIAAFWIRVVVHLAQYPASDSVSGEMLFKENTLALALSVVW